MKIFEIISKLPDIMTILMILKDVDMNKDGKASATEWLITALRIMDALMKLSAQEKQMLAAFIEFLKTNDSGLTSLILKLKGSM